MELSQPAHFFPIRHLYNKWVWEKEILISLGSQFDNYRLADNINEVPLKVSGKIKYNKKEIYCSKIDIIYKSIPNLVSATMPFTDEDYMYKIASLNCTKNIIPFFATRFKMSSQYSSIYAAITLSSIKSNMVKEVRVSSIPNTLKSYSCADLTFEYVNA